VGAGAMATGHGRGLAVGEWRAFLWCAAGSVAFSAWFIWRASFRLGGHRTWVLFDDAMVSMRYARNLARGDGLVWNAGGPRVEGITNPLWTLWMAVLHLLPVDVFRQSLLVMISGAFLLVGVLAVARRLAGEIAPDRPAIATIAMVLCATFYPLVYWSLAGTEVGLLALLTGVITLYGVRVARRPDEWAGRDDLGLAAASVAAVATRLDAALVVGVVVAFGVVAAGRGRRWVMSLRLGGPAAGALVVMTAARRVYYGDWLPNTWYLKAAGTPLGLRLSTGARQLVVVLVAQLAVVAVVALVGLWVARDWMWWLLATVVGVQVVYSVAAGGDAWEYLLIANRYLTVVVVPGSVLAARGLLALVESPQRLLPRWCWALGAAAALVAVGSPKPPIYTRELSVHDLLADLQDHRAVYLGAAAVLAAVGWACWHRVRLGATQAAVLVTAVVIVATNARALNAWRMEPAAEMKQDFAREGWALREATTPDTTVAVWLAGADPYFSDRPGVDLLGKSDRHLARQPATNTTSFLPGHNKIDVPWSLDTYRPDLFREPIYPIYQQELRDLGYKPVTPRLWVLRSSLEKVDLRALRKTQQ